MTDNIMENIKTPIDHKPLTLRHRIKWVVIIIFLFFFFSISTWLAMPLDPPEKGDSLLHCFPESEFPVTLEARQLSDMVRGMDKEGTLRKLVAPPFVREKDSEKILKMLVGDDSSKIALWALGHQSAIGVAKNGKDMAARVRFNNVCVAVLYIAEAFNPGIYQEHAIKAGFKGNIFTTWHGRDFLVATDRELLKSISTVDSADPVVSTYPDYGIVSRVCPGFDKDINGRFRKFAGKDMPVNKMQMEVSWGSGYVRSRTRTVFKPEVSERLIDSLQARHGTRYSGTIWQLDESTAPADKDSAVVAVDGVADLKMLWYCFSRVLWDEKAMPVPGESQPMTIVVWKALKKAVIDEADGRFSLRLLKCPQTTKTTPVPEVRAVLGVGKPEDAYRLFNREGREVLELFRAPGGNELWETVRRDTFLRELDNPQHSRLEVNELFFHEMSPYWGPVSEGISFGTHYNNRKNDTGGEAAFVKGGSNDSVTADLRIRWSIDESEFGKLVFLVQDHADNHGFASEKAALHLKKLFEKCESFRSIYPAGSLAIKAYMDRNMQVNGVENNAENKSGKKSFKNGFVLDTDAIFEL